MPDVSISVLTTEGEVESILPFWREASAKIENAPDFYQTVNSVRESSVSPYIVVASRDGGPIALMLCRLTETELAARIGYRRFGEFKVRSLTAIYNGLVGSQDVSVVQAMCEHVSAELSNGTADIAEFRYVAEHSVLHSALDTLQIPKRRRAFGPIEVHRVLDLPDDPEGVKQLRSSSTRKRMRRYARAIEETDGFRLQVFNDAADLDQIMDDIEIVAAKTYQRSMKSGFFHNSEWREMMRLGFEKKWFRLWIVYFGDRPVTYAGGYSYKGVFFSFLKGYDPEFSHLSVGTYLLMRMCAELIAEGGVSQIDYGFGDAQYKRDYSTQHWDEQTHRLFAPTLRAERIALTMRAIEFTSNSARKTAHMLGVEQMLKKRLRSAMTGREKTGDDD